MAKLLTVFFFADGNSLRVKNKTDHQLMYVESFFMKLISTDRAASCNNRFILSDKCL
jgi:hypothetical protein